MKILDRQKVLAASLQPVGPITSVTFRTMPVATRVVQIRLRFTHIALVNPTAHLSRTAGRQGAQHLTMLRRESTLAPCNERRPVTTYYFADFRRRRLAGE